MKFLDGFDLVQKAYIERDKEKWFRVWLVRQPSENEHLIPFEKWYLSLYEQVKEMQYTSKLTNEEILEKVRKNRERKLTNEHI